ncbi:MAG: antibiotic ABC transporter ATP-binding protein [Flammeovirgaceae bacterium TMED32]|nr:MAG: antibiotic ABC transporter ATP-binding protein [Flammeovirgaceae bacterium TMED32]
MNQEPIQAKKIVDSKVLKKLFAFAKPYIYQFWILVFLTISMAAVVPLRPYVIRVIIDNQIALGDNEGLVYMIVLLLGLLLLQSIVQYLHTFLSGFLGQFVIKDIRIKLFRHVQSLRLKFFDQTPIGRLVTRNVSDIETLAEVFSQGVAAIIGDLLQLLVIFGFMLYIDWELALISLSTLPVLILATYIFKERVKVSFNTVRTAVSNLNTFVQEHITGMNIVQIFNSESTELKKFKEINKEHRTANIKSVMYYSIYFPVAEIVQASGIGLVVWFGAGGVIQERIEVGVLIAFIMYIQMFFRPIRMIADRFNTLQMGIVCATRIMDLLDNKETTSNTGVLASEALKGTVKFEQVWFAYNEEDWVLKNISFEVKSGKTLALVGATGAGKSSIVNLLNRFYEINKGHIYIDGQEIKNYELSFLRKNIAVVLQDVFLLSDSIFNNITLKNPKISREQVYQAADLVGASTFIERLPGGYDYDVMERGATLSMGQRQLISFVRALVYDPKIIILDEATSSVDSDTEFLIQGAISKLMKGRTAIVVAHRLSTIQNADNIMVLDRGEIKEQGTHDDLLNREGYYANLHEMQFKEVIL